MSTPTDDGFKLPPALELDRIISMQEAEKVSSLSVNSWKRHHADKLVELSPRRIGVRLRDALMLSKDRAFRVIRSIILTPFPSHSEGAHRGEARPDHHLNPIMR